MIEQLKKDNGISTDSLTTPWFMSFICLTLGEESFGGLTVVKSTRRITLLQSLVTEVGGYHDNELPYQSTAFLPQSTVLGPDYRDGDAEQAFRPYHFRND